MTLQEFIERHDTHGFVKRNFEKMNACISMLANTSGREFEDYSSRANNCYFSIYGYLNAMYGHGDLSDDDWISLGDELLELFKNQE